MTNRERHYDVRGFVFGGIQANLDLLGTPLSGWLSTRYNSRYLLFCGKQLRSCGIPAGPAAIFDATATFVITAVPAYLPDNYAELLIPTSNYWNVIHGRTPGEVSQDAEGAQIMRVLGKNMAWLMKLVKHGRGTILPPEREVKIFTNFIR